MKTYKDVRKEELEYMYNLRQPTMDEFSVLIEEKTTNFFDGGFIQYHGNHKHVVKDFEYYNTELKKYGWQLEINYNKLETVIIDIRPYVEPQGMRFLLKKYDDFLDWLLK